MKPKKEARKAGKGSSGAAAGGSQTVEEIRLRAYEIYIRRGRTDGRDLEDWLQADKELTQIAGKRLAN
jgi:Protein of unknown function (DUF2934)